MRNHNDSIRVNYGRRTPAYRRSGFATAGKVAAGTAISGFFLVVLAWIAVKFTMLPTFIVNLVYLWNAYHTAGGMNHFDPTWLIISGVVVIFG